MRPLQHFGAAFLFALFVFLTGGCTDGEGHTEAAEPAVPAEPAQRQPQRSPSLGKLPAFALPTAEGDTLRLSDLEGDVVLLNFWATWCPPCIREIPDLKALYAEFGGRGLNVVGVSVDETGLEAVRPFMAEMDIDYPIVVDDGTLASQFGGVWSLPTTFVMDREGNVVRRVLGIFPTEEMRPLLIELLEASTP